MTGTNMCPVCGFTGLLDPPYTDAGGPSNEICPSCGFEFGYTDDDLGYTFEVWRAEWVASGSHWYSKSDLRPAPVDWDPAEQLKNLQR